MKFPKRIKHRGNSLATIYGKSSAYPQYRVAWSVQGKRRMKAFDHYGGEEGALAYAEQLVKDLAKGSQVTALTPEQAADALTALQRLEAYRQATGKRVSLLAAVAEFAEAATKLNGSFTLAEAIERFQNTVANVKRIDLKQAVGDFITSRKHLAESKDGKRSKHSPDYEGHVSFWLNEFADTFPGNAVCDLTKTHLDAYMGQFKELSGKSRNDRRTTVKMFLRWCVAKDYLAQNHRLFEAVGFKAESAEVEEIDFYRPKELAAMLRAGNGLLPVIALSALAGLRIQECLRLDWSDVWRVEGKVEISARIAKGRQRRLVTMGPALAQWLEPYRRATGPVCDKNPMQFNRAFVNLRESLEIPARRNGLRHGFVSFHYALNSNENLVAAEAGNSPQMVHDHYRGLATKGEAEKWFAVAPERRTNVIPFAKPAAAV